MYCHTSPRARGCLNEPSECWSSGTNAGFLARTGCGTRAVGTICRRESCTRRTAWRVITVLSTLAMLNKSKSRRQRVACAQAAAEHLMHEVGPAKSGLTGATLGLWSGGGWWVVGGRGGGEVQRGDAQWRDTGRKGLRCADSLAPRR